MPVTTTPETATTTTVIYSAASSNPPLPMFWNNGQLKPMPQCWAQWRKSFENQTSCKILPSNATRYIVAANAMYYVAIWAKKASATTIH